MWLLLGCAPAITPGETGAIVLPEGRAQVASCPPPARRTTPASIVRLDPREAEELAEFALSPRPAPGRLDLTLLIDRSGSMDEEGRMLRVKAGLRRIAERLAPGDRLAIVAFDNEPCTPLENWIAGRDDPGALADAIASITPRGSTDLASGLHEAYRVATRSTDLRDDTRLRRLLLVTDALLDAADVPVATTAEVERAWVLHHLRLSTVAVGRRADGPLLQRLAALGQGRHGAIALEAPGIALRR